MAILEELIKEMPPEIQKKARDVLEFLLQKRIQHPKSPQKQIASCPSLEIDGKSNFSKARRIALARSELLRLYRKTVANALSGEKEQAKKKFLWDYNTGYFPQIYAILGKTSRSSVELWNRKLRKTGDVWNLMPRWGQHRKNKTKVTPEQQHCLKDASTLFQNRPLAVMVRIAKKRMVDQGVDDTCSEQTYKRFLERWRKRHFETKNN